MGVEIYVYKGGARRGVAGQQLQQHPAANSIKPLTAAHEYSE